MLVIFNDIKVRYIYFSFASAEMNYLDFLFVENFEALAELITAYPQINQRTHFVLVPGPLDITLNSILPRRPLLSSFVSRMRNKVNKIHFASNPCRIKFFGQEIVIFREDTMARMLRNTIRVKQEAEGDDLRRYVSGLVSFVVSGFNHDIGLDSWYRQFWIKAISVL